MGEKKTILIVDDHPFFREGLKSLILKNEGYEIVGEAGNGEEGLKKAKELRPDIVIMDLSLPDTSGIEVTRNIREHLAEIQVLILSMHLKVEYVTEAFRAGATGYVTKESTTERLFECLDALVEGKYFLDSSLHHIVVGQLLEPGNKETMSAEAGYNALTPREREVLILLAEGLAAEEVADKLFISKKTVENHKAHIMSKLDLHSTMELVRYAAKYGLIDVSIWKK